MAFVRALDGWSRQTWEAAGTELPPDDVSQGRSERLEPIRFVPPITRDKTDPSALGGTCGSSVNKWWRRRESNSNWHVPLTG